MAAAIGRSVNIPIIVRTLSLSLKRSGYKLDAGFMTDLDLVAYLDGDLRGAGPQDLGRLVDTFHLSWWYGSTTSLDSAPYLNFDTIRAALEKH